MAEMIGFIGVGTMGEPMCRNLVRKSGLEYFADIHVEVDPNMTVADGHLIGHQVKDRLKESIPIDHNELPVWLKHNGGEEERGRAEIAAAYEEGPRPDTAHQIVYGV